MASPQSGLDIIAEADAANPASYQVLARKYRPQSFDDLIGQDAMVRTLSNAFESGRIAHAFILTGVRGVGKTTTARILARALNYTNPEAGIDVPALAFDTLGTHCADIMAGSHVDVLEMDAASHTGIDDIREIINNVRYAPVAARHKVYIIDEVHMLSRSAFNGLLKTLEEPPPYVKFIFATTEIRAVPITVLSRCQRFDLRRLTLDEITALLEKVCGQEKIALPAETLAVIARAADGSARDALSLLDRAFAHTSEKNEESAVLSADDMRTILGMANRERLFDLFDSLFKGDLSAALSEFETHYNLGVEPATIIGDLAELIYWLTRIKFVPAAGDDVTFSEAMRQRGREAATALSTRILARAWQILLQGHQDVRNAANGRAAAEMVLIRLAHISDAPTPEELIRQFENNPANAAPVSAAPAASPAPPTTPPTTAPQSAPTAPSTNTPTNAAASALAPALSSPQSSAASPAPQSQAKSHLAAVPAPETSSPETNTQEAEALREPQVRAALAAFPNAAIKAVNIFGINEDDIADDSDEDDSV